MISSCIRLLVILLLLSGSTLSHGDTPDNESVPPRIGLVLSGGGARGAAHIGVLKVLEELRIPVHAIAGTSVGSLVGGLYASGMSPGEIEDVVRDIDWEAIFDDSPNRENQSFRRKRDNGRYIPNLEVGLRNGRLMMPTGLTSGRKVSFLLHRLLLRNGFTQDFDQLRIPFRAVATDLATGEMVVQQDGDLADALRASMSVPGAIAPFETDGKLLADGGLVRNLPVDVIQTMDVDVIIAVNVAKGLFARERLNSALAVSQQMITIMLLKDEANQVAKLTDQDIYIHPELGDMAASDFAHLIEAIRPGEDAARLQQQQLTRYSLSENDYEHYLDQQRGANVNRQVVDFVNVSDSSRLHPNVLLSRIRTQTGQELNLGTLQHDLDRIYQIGTFDSVSFQWVEDTDRNGILIHTRPKPWGNNFLQFGVNLSDDLEGNSRVDMLLAHTMTEINSLGGEWRNELQAGQKRSFRSEFFQPLDYAGHWAIIPYLEYASVLRDFYDIDDNWNRMRIRLFNSGLNIGRQFENWGLATLGIFRSTGNANPLQGQDNSLLGQRTDIDIAGYQFRFLYDQLDDPYFPRKGDSGHLILFHSDPGLGAHAEYDKLDFQYQRVFPFDVHTLMLSLEYGDSLGSTLPVYDAFQMGGLLRLSGYREGQLLGNVKSLITAMYYVELPFKAFGFRFYAGGTLEAGNVWENRNLMDVGDLRYSGSVFLGSRTMVGGAYLGYARSDDGDNRFYFTIGQIF